MNLLNSIFDDDEREINIVNKKYWFIIAVIIFIFILLLFIPKDYYYVNKYSIINDEILLYVEKDYVNKIKQTNKLIINDIENEYRINKITSLNNDYIINISLDVKNENINDGIYKINLGKESFFYYIIRIIKK